MKVTVLGCGASLGVPAAGGFWGDCNPNNPKNERTRASILIETENTTVLVDTTPDVRQHLNTYNVQRLDGVILSHAHSDHISGMDDLRVISYRMGEPIKAFTNKETAAYIAEHRSYAVKDSTKIYKAFMNMNVCDYGVNTIGDIDFHWFEQEHKTCKTIGLRIGDFAYSVDMMDLNPDALATLHGVKTWIVDCGGYKLDHDKITTHANLEMVKKWSKDLNVENTYLTVLTGRMDYDEVSSHLPENMHMLYDGFSLTF